MSWGSDVVRSFDTGYEGIKEKRKKNKIAEILSQAYQQPQAEVPFQTDEEQLFGMQGLQGNVAQEAQPGGMNYGNAIARMYQQGYGPEAFQLEQQLQDRELGGLLKRSQIAKALRPNLGEAKAGVMDSKDVFFRTDDAGNTYDLSGNRITGTIQPRPQQPLVNLDMSGKQHFTKKLAEEQGKIYGEAQKAASEAGDILSSLDQLESILPEVRTGMLAPFGTKVGAGIEAVGGKATKFGLADPAKAQQFEAVANKLALGARQGMPGAMSDSDRQFLVNSVANLGRTPEANQEIINNFRMAAQRAQEKAVAQDRWVKQNGNLTGFNESWNKYVRENPLFQKSTTKQYKLGSIIEKGGRKYRIIKLDPNGDHEVAPVR